MSAVTTAAAVTRVAAKLTRVFGRRSQSARPPTAQTKEVIAVVISVDEREMWDDLRSRLRSFVARRVSSPDDVDDIVQDVFLRMQRGLPALRDERRFGPWVYRVARSAVAEYRRTRARHPSADGEVPEQHAPAPDDDGNEDAFQKASSCVAALVTRLPSPYREAITLSELQGTAQSVAAGRAGVSLSGMKSRVQRGRKLLRERLLGCCDVGLDARNKVISCAPHKGQQSRGGSSEC